jgi:hypothetical protein
VLKLSRSVSDIYREREKRERARAREREIPLVIAPSLAVSHAASCKQAAVNAQLQQQLQDMTAKYEADLAQQTRDLEALKSESQQVAITITLPIPIPTRVFITVAVADNITIAITITIMSGACNAQGQHQGARTKLRGGGRGDPWGAGA